MDAKLKPAYILSAVVALLAAVASAAGLFAPTLYRDNSLVTAAWRGNDLITLAVAVPVLLGALIGSRRGSVRAQLLWIGMLGYMLYNYMFYLYGAAFNACFLVYVALFAGSAYALIISLSSLDIARISRRFSPRTPVKWISGYMLFFALLLGGLWIAMSLGFVLTGKVPEAITQTGHPTGVVFATDLSLLVPGLVLAAVLLWRRQPWGYALASMMMIKCSTYGPALIAMSVFAEKISADALLPLWIFLTGGCLVATSLLLCNIHPEDR